MLSRLLKKEEINRFKLDNNSYQKFVKRNFCNYPWRFYKNGQKLLREDRYNSQCISNHDKNRTYFFHRFTEAYLYPFSHGQKFFVRKRLSTPFQLPLCKPYVLHVYSSIRSYAKRSIFTVITETSAQLLCIPQVYLLIHSRYRDAVSSSETGSSSPDSGCIPRMKATG